MLSVLYLVWLAQEPVWEINHTWELGSYLMSWKCIICSAFHSQAWCCTPTIQAFTEGLSSPELKASVGYTRPYLKRERKKRKEKAHFPSSLSHLVLNLPDVVCVLRGARWLSGQREALATKAGDLSWILQTPHGEDLFSKVVLFPAHSAVVCTQAHTH